MEHISKFIEDERFICWVFQGDERLDAWWKSYAAAHPDEKESILLARRVLEKLHTADRELPEKERIILFARILKQIEEKEKQVRTIKLVTGFLKYAAVALLFFSAGALLFYQKNNISPQFVQQDLSAPVQTDQAKLMRPGFGDILLARNSRVEYRDDGQVVVNDSIVEAQSATRQGVPGMNQLVIPYGKTSELKLPDGSRVWLNAGSRLIYPGFFPGKTREVFLVGEAFFQVSQDAAKPFIVQTADIRVNVVGTRFNISAYPGDNTVETVLTEGKIRLERSNAGLFSESLDMIPGQLAAFGKSDRTFVMTEVDVENYTLWKEGLMKFESTDLSRVVKKLERYYNIHFRYQDPFLGGIKITGKLELDESCASVLAIVADAASVKITRIGEGYFEITRK